MHQPPIYMGQGSVMFLACPSVVRAEAGAFLDRFAVDLQLKLVVTCIGADFRFEVPGQSSVGLIGARKGPVIRGAPWRVRSTSL